MARKTTDLLVEALVNEGVERIYGVPGEENIDLVESLAGAPIELVLTRHEQAAAFMAAAEGRLTGQPGVCLATLGPGATNLLTGVAQAHLAGMPLICLSGQKPIDDRAQGRFQILDVVAMMRPVTKHSQAIIDEDEVPALVRDAFRLAAREKPGAVHLELAEDVARRGAAGQVLPVSHADPPGASQASLDAAAERIRAAERPLLLFASGANRGSNQDAARELVERSGLPFFTTQMGKGAVDDAHPSCLGTATLSSGDSVHEAVAQADLIVNVGHDLCEKPPFVMESDGAEVVHVAFQPAIIDRVYFPQLEVVGCLQTNLRQLAERLEGVASVECFAAVRERYEAQVLSGGADLPVDHPRRLVHDVRSALPEEAVVSLDNGMYKLWFSRYYRAAEPHTLLLDNALATMGAGLPVAIGAKRAWPERPVVVVAGDGGLLMNGAEVETAIRLDLDLVIVVVRDDALGMIRWKQKGEGFRDYGLAFGNPDFVAWAESYGATGHRVGEEGLRPLLEEALAAGGVHLIEAPIDYSPNQDEFG